MGVGSYQPLAEGKVSTARRNPKKAVSKTLMRNTNNIRYILRIRVCDTKLSSITTQSQECKYCAVTWDERLLLPQEIHGLMGGLLKYG